MSIVTHHIITPVRTYVAVFVALLVLTVADRARGARRTSAR